MTATTASTPATTAAQPAVIANLAELEAALRAFAGPNGQAMRLAVDGAGRLIVTMPDGSEVSFAGTEALAGILSQRLPQFTDELRMAQVDLGRLLRAYEMRLINEPEWQAEVFRIDRLLSDVIPRDGSLTFQPGNQTGRDGGHLHNDFNVGRIGRTLPHLPPQPGEDPLFQNDDRRLLAGGLIYAGTEGADLASNLYPSDILSLPGAGSALNHLQPQPDDPSRFSIDFRDRDTDIATPRSDDIAPPAPSSMADAFRMREDGRLEGSLFGNDFVPGAVRDVLIDGPRPPGDLTINPDGSFSYRPPAHLSGEVRFTYRFTDIASGITVSAEAVITIDPVVDPAAVSVPPSPVITLEDVPVRIPGLAASLVDADGSEVLSVRIAGVPPGGSFGSGGRDLGGGVWSFTPAELTAGPVFTPPADLHGDIVLTLEAVTRETATAETAIVQRPFTISITAVADAPVVTTAAVIGNEDSAIGFGSAISIAKPDNDGSEHVSAVEISAFPAGWLVSFAANPNVTIVGGGSGPFILSVASPVHAAALLAVLNSAAVTPPANSDADAAVIVRARTTDHGGAAAWSAATPLTVAVQAVADPASVTGGAGGLEDTVIALPIAVALTDTDGSETLRSVEISGVPAGATLGWTPAAGGTALALPGGGVVFSGTADAIRDLLQSVTITPAADSDADFELTISATVDESNPSEPGGVATLTSVTIGKVPVTVTAVADVPDLAGTSSTTIEDTAVVFGTGISFAVTDVDGSEQITRLVLTGVPAGATLSWNTALPGSVTAPAAGSLQIDGTQGQIRALLDSLAITPALHDDSDFTLSITATVTDNDGSTAFRSSSHDIIVTAAADAPTLSVGAGVFNTPEDVPVALPGLAGALVDADGSETVLYRIVGVPAAGVFFTTGTEITPGTWEFTPAQLAAGLTLDPPTNFAGTIALTLTGFTRETSNGDAAQTSLPFTVVVGDVPDIALIPTTITTGNEDAATTFGANVTYALTDTDGSEVVSRVTIGAIPAGSVVSYLAAGSASVQLIAGQYVIAGPQADIRATLDSFSLTPPANADSDINLSITVTTRESDGAERDTIGTHRLLIAAVADQPLIAGGATGNEDSAIAVPITVTRADADGSETIDFVEITNIPPGAAAGYDAGLPGSVTALAGGLRIEGSTAQIQAILASFTITPPTNSDADFALTVRAGVRESNPSEAGDVAVATAERSFVVPVTVTAVADAPSVAIAPVAGNEDSAIVFGTAITTARPDNDGSEHISAVEIGAFPAGWAVAFDANPNVTVTGAANGPYVISIASAAHEAALQAVLDSFRVTPPANSDADAAVAMRAQSTDADGSTAWGATQPLTVVVDAVSDAPVLATAPLAVEEDTPVVFGTAITWTKPDNDGSERISRVELSGLPTAAGSAVTFTATGGATVAADGLGGYVITGPSEAGIRATLDSFAVRQATNSDADIAITVRAQTTDGIAAPSAFATATLTIAVDAEADAPIVPNALIIGLEDTAIAFGTVIAPNKPDNDGSEWISAVEIRDFPASWTVTFTANPAVTVTGTGAGPYLITIADKADGAALQTLLGSIRVTAGPNSDTNAGATVRAQTTDADGSTAWGAGTYIPVVVDAVSDAPVLATAPLAVEEDTSVVFGAAITWTKPDNDGSERISRVELSGLPTAAGSAVTFTASGGATVTPDGLGGYVITGPTEAGIRATLDSFAVRQATNSDADIAITVRAQTTDGIAAPSAFATATLTIAVDAEADAPIVPNALIIGLEDTAIAFGTVIAPNKPDNDGSEWISAVEIRDFPASWTVTFTANPAVTVTGTGAGPYLITIADKADGAALQTLLGSIRVTAGPNSDTNAGATVRAQTTDADGSTAWGAGTYIPVVVDAVSDAPVLATAPLAVEEDTSVVFGAAITWTKPDNDGSERISRVELSGLPTAAGSAVTFTATGGATVTPDGLGGYAVTGPTEAGIRATLDSFAVRQATNSDADIAITVRAQTNDGIAAPSAFATATLAIAVDAEADAPIVPNALIIGLEDTAIAFGTVIAPNKPDNDGSEWISAVEIRDFPASWTVTFTANPAVTVTGTGAGPYLITIADKADGAALQAVLGSIRVTAGPNSDTNAGATVRAQTTDADGSTAWGAGTYIPVVVDAVSDAPVLATAPLAVEEDTPVVFGAAITWTKPDNDGSERISRVELSGLPTAAGSAVTFTASGGATVTPDGLGGYVITGPSEAGIRATLDSFAVTQATNSDADIAITVRAQTTDGIAAPSAFATATLTIAVDAEADAPTVANGPVVGNEDSAIVFGTAITTTKPDNDGTEHISAVEIGAFPAGWAVAFDANPNVTVTGAANGPYVISIASAAHEAALQAVLDSFRVTPPANSDADASVAVRAQSTDADGSTAWGATAPLTVVVTAVPDAPGASALSTSGTEDTFIPLTLGSVASGDSDSSETLTLRITGVPTNGTFSAGTDLGGGVWSFTQAQLTGLSFRPPPQFHGPIPMTLVARSTESSNGAFVETTAPFTVTSTAVLDPVNLSNSTQTVNEDTTIGFGTLLNIGLIDLDGSQSLRYDIAGIPAGYTIAIAGGLPAGVTLTYPVAGTARFEGANAGTVINAIRAASFTVGGAATHKDANFTLNLTGTTQEVDGSTNVGTATHFVRVRAVADQTTNSVVLTPANEDPGAAIAVPITVALRDTDGSEVLNRVDVTITNPATHPATIGWNTGLPGTVTGIANGFRFTGTTAQIQALLASVTVTPVLHNGSDIAMRVVSRTQEANPSEAGAPDMATEFTTSPNYNFTINMVPVADAPTVTTPGLGAPFTAEEDVRIQLTGLGGARVDTDGSETLTFRIENVPTGANFYTASTGTTLAGADAGGGVWTFTAAQMTAGLWFQPPANFSGTRDMTLVAISTETEVVANRVATTSAPFRVIIDPQADQPTVTGSSTVDEDGTVAFGANVITTLADSDGSEYISRVEIASIPSGWTLGYTSHPSVTVMGSGTGPYTLLIASAVHAAALQTVLDSLTLTPPAQSDADGFGILIFARATDLDGSHSTSVASNHAIIVRAVADAPAASAVDVAGNEDTAIALNLSAGASVDTDGSERLSARILDVPAGSLLTGNLAGGGTLADSGGGVWTITAPSDAQLNVILASLQYTAPLHRSGPVTMRLEVTATEAANGGQVAVKSTATIDPFTVMVTAVADLPTLHVINATGGAAGREDTAIPLSIASTLVDGDGSETLSLRIADVPTGASFVDGGGVPIGSNLGGGVWSFTQAQLADIRIRPPLHSNDDFTLNLTLRATESTVGVPGLGDFREVSSPLQVQVIGVADTPALTVSTVNATEDQPIPLGAAITGSLDDTDGSETLYYVLSGLPAGVLPSVGTFIGGEWQISASDLASLTIPSPPNFSGNYTATFAPGLKVRAVAQENDGDQASVERALNVVIAPVMDAFGGWSPAVTVNEGSDIPLANAAFAGLADNDGSEAIASYTFNLNGVVAAAQIAGVTPNVADFIANHITGAFTDNGDGTITVLAANLGGVALRSQAFLDSNIDFTIPVSALVTEASGLTQVVNGAYSVNLVGVADVPTAFASDVTAVTGQPTAITLGGLITDADAGLGRANSERIYYIMQGPDATTLGTNVAFVNGAGQIAGLNNNDGSWYLTEADLVGLRITSRFGFIDTVTLTLTSVTVENDGSLATAATPATFTATFTADPGGSGGGVNPLPPTIAITPMTANEDGNIVFTVTVTPAPGDPSPTAPTVSLFISDLPAGALITGATLNPNTGRYIATAADLASGQVRISPPANFSGTLPITVEAVAMNTQLNTATTGAQTVNVTVTPVADGPSISANPAPGLEDTATALNIGVGLPDSDIASPEQLDGPVRITVSNGATLSAGTLVSPGVYDLTPAQLAGLTVTPPANWHGDIAVSISATSREPGNGDTRTSVANVTVAVRAAADIPNATAADVSGAEDQSIALTGLSAALVDGDGSERLSVKIVGIPEGSILSAGANNGDGSWTIPVAALAGLSILPPKHYSGVMSLLLDAYALDADGSTATRGVPFTVTVSPTADAPTIDPRAVGGAENVPVALNLGLRMSDTNGTNPGENPAELIELTFTGIVTGTSLTSAGGLLEQLSATSWRFTGSQAEAATLAYVAGNDHGFDTIDVSAVAIDGASRSAAVAGSFVVATTAQADAPRLLATAAAGPAGSTIALNIEAALRDLDGSETLSAITLGSVPAGVTFSAGTSLGGGNWSFTQPQLAGLTMTLPVAQTSFSLTVGVTATESSNADAAMATTTLAVTVGAGGAAITGDAAANTLGGGAGDDTIAGGAGADILTGGAGADIMVWLPGDLGPAPDQITDFSLLQNDRLDLGAILPGYGGGPLTGFVQFVEGGGNTAINIDPTGGGAFTTSLAVLQGVTGLNVETMRTTGHIIA